MNESPEAKQRRIDIARQVIAKRRQELGAEALGLRLSNDWTRLGQIAEEYGRLSEEEGELNRGIVTYYCVVCQKVPVDAEGGYDTCESCLKKV